MRMPIKLNRSYWSKTVTNLLPSSDDPRVLLGGEVSGEQFSRAISAFKFGNTYKTTENFRFPTTVKALASLSYQSPPIVLDVGASDGITSLHVLKNINYDKYYITDLNTEVLYEKQGGRCSFYDKDNNCILIVTKLFSIYSDLKNSIFPFNIIVKHLLSNKTSKNCKLRKIELINPDVKKTDGDIVIKNYDIFNKWEYGNVDLILAANVLNRCYFSDECIVKAIGNFVKTLNEGGRLVVVDSREVEKSTIFRVVNCRVEVEKDINGGTEIRDLVLQNFS